MNFGSIFAFLFVVVVCIVAVLSATLEDIKMACKKEHKFEGDLESLNYNDPSFPKEAKCALACGLEKKDVLKADGTIDKEKEKELIEEAVKNEDLKKKYLKAIDECNDTAKSDKCETAFQFVKCKRNKAGVE